MSRPRVSVVTLGCARNDVDSDELQGRLRDQGFDVGGDEGEADVVLVNTCGFIAAAKKDSIDTVLDLAEGGAPVVVAGCLAERYGAELAESLPEAAAVLGFDDYPDIADRLRRVMAGETLPAHEPRDRRRLLPLSPVERGSAAVVTPGHGAGAIRRVVTGPSMSVKLASGCDRRCSFCAIPRFRGSFVSRPPQDILDEITQLADGGAREIVLVSENSTSYGKDLGDLRLLEALLPSIAAVPGIVRVRVNYLQPAEMRPSLVRAIAETDGVAAYFDLSFQHASATVLRRMRRFGGTDDFLALLDGIRSASPGAGARSNVIVGFPGETEDDVEELVAFLAEARLDGIGVFGFSTEDGTEAAEMPGQLDEAEIAARVSHVSSAADDAVLQRAEERVGELLDVLVEDVIDGPGTTRAAIAGRAEHQGPEDTDTAVDGAPASLSLGDVVRVRVVATQGPDLVAVPA
ncbi:MAG: MiaB/RimO family radical SAM methylthiotransferase [bacterium]